MANTLSTLLQSDRHSSFRQPRSKWDQRTTDTDTDTPETEALHLQLWTNTTPSRTDQGTNTTPGRTDRGTNTTPVVTQTEYDQNSGRNENWLLLQQFTWHLLPEASNDSPPIQPIEYVKHRPPHYTTTFSIMRKIY